MLEVEKVMEMELYATDRAGKQERIVFSFSEGKDNFGESPKKYRHVGKGENIETGEQYYIKYVYVNECKEEGIIKKDALTQYHCMENEGRLIECFKKTVPYLLLPKYQISSENEEENEMIMGVLYPNHNGKTYDDYINTKRSSLYIDEIMLLKEKIILQILYGMKAYSSLESGAVHRDIKPGNITIQNLPENEMLVSIIDFDWMHIENKVEARWVGGTLGYAHPSAYHPNKEGEVHPVFAWDIYGAALTFYYILEEKKHFLENEYSMGENQCPVYADDSKIGYTLKEMKNTEKNLLQIAENEKKAFIQLEMIQNILQKMLGGPRCIYPYHNIDEIIYDYEQYLKYRHGSKYLSQFKLKYFLKNDDARYFNGRVFQILCQEEEDGKKGRTYHMILAENDIATLEIDGKKIISFYSVENTGLSGIILDDDWKLVHEIKNMDTGVIEKGTKQIKIMYKYRNL